MLLDEIVSLATDGKSSLRDLLRNCLVLAYKLKNDELKGWVQHELDGYGEADPLPDYRRTGSQVRGIFEGWGRSVFSRPIPSMLLDANHREKLAGPVDLRQGIGAYEELLSMSPPVQVSLAWDANYIVYYQTKFFQDSVLISAAREIPRPSLVEMMDTVRNRVLKMALDLRAELGGSDPNLDNIPADEAKKINESVIQTIYAQTVFVAAGQSTMQVQQHNLFGDWYQLQQALQSSGLTEPEAAELSVAVDQDGKKLGPKVQQWLREMAPKVVAGGVNMGAEIGKQILAQYVKQYLGLPS